MNREDDQKPHRKPAWIGAIAGIVVTLIATAAAVVSASVDIGLFPSTRTGGTSEVVSATPTTQLSVTPPPTSTVPDPEYTSTSEPTSELTRFASFDLLVGIRPQLGQLAENMELLLEDESLVTWSANQGNSPRRLQLEATPGQHEYEIRGEYTYVNAAGFPVQYQAYGSGTVTISDGARISVNYLGGNTFVLAPY